ncbi:LOW QUALITY PROTEIN: IOD1-like protein [Mya arenaria]|uniref:Iodothyronine deiodinase n=1 Tax=Mya arenaria TaxID=6604 RepID=A0ABY7EWM5_MYAAR|nr:LOW QUALITY PROTEIN: IOD1-like protein [Mya arenaria]
MAKLAQFNQLVDDFAHEIDFVTIYIKEAHPLNGWNLIGNKHYIRQHETIQDRIKAAKLLSDSGCPLYVDTIRCPLYVDTMDNDAQIAFSSFPESLFVLEKGKIAFKALGPFAYDPCKLRSWINGKRVKSNKLDRFTAEMFWILRQIKILILTLLIGTARFLLLASMDTLIIPVCKRLPEKWKPKRLAKTALNKTYKTNVSYKTFLQCLRVVYQRQKCNISVGMTAPNAKVVSLDKKLHNILDFRRSGRLLVVNFGSCT